MIPSIVDRITHYFWKSTDPTKPYTFYLSFPTCCVTGCLLLGFEEVLETQNYSKDSVNYIWVRDYCSEIRI